MTCLEPTPPTPNSTWQMSRLKVGDSRDHLRQVNPSWFSLQTPVADEDVDAIVGTLNLLRMNIIPKIFYTSWWLNQPRKLNGFIFPNFRGENETYLKPPPHIYIYIYPHAW